MIDWQQISRVNRHPFDCGLLILFLWQMIPHSLERWVDLSRFQQNSYDGQVSTRIRVNHMDHHVEALSIDKLLARMVKMELRELVAMIADGDKAPRCIVHHNGVTVIDDGERRSMVVELDRRQVGLFCVADAIGD